MLTVCFENCLPVMIEFILPFRDDLVDDALAEEAQDGGSFEGPLADAVEQNIIRLKLEFLVQKTPANDQALGLLNAGGRA